MPDWSRRRALHAAVSAATVALAGCSGEGGVSRSVTTRGRSSADRVTDYETKQVRNADGTVLVRRADAETETEREDDDRRVSLYEHLTDTEEVSEYEFAADASEATTLERFVRATDLDTQSVFLYQQSIPACYDVRLVEVRRKEDSVSVHFCRDLKPADVACERDDQDTVAVAVRLPFPGDDFNGQGVGMSGSCRGPGRAFGGGGGGA